MRGRSGNDRGEMRGKFLGRRPLIEARIRPAPHRHFSVAERLLGKPFDDVVSIARLLRKGFEFTGRVTAAANIDKRKYVAVRREICSVRMVSIRDVGS